MPINANAVLNRLQDQTIRDRSYLEASFTTNGEAARAANESDEAAAHPIMDKFITDLGSEGIRTLTNFTVTEFETLWSFVDTAMQSAWMEGRDRRSPTSPKDAMFMALTVLKHFSSWEKHTADYGFKAPTFEKLITRVLSVIEPIFYRRFITPVTMAELTQTGQRFAHFPYALYAVDVKFQPSNRPAGRFAEQKHYFSGKYHLYGYKIEAAMSPDGRCVAMSTADPGSVHDLTIMNSRKHVHPVNLAKSASESLVPDHGEQAALHRGSWACLVDMGYIGISHSLRGIHPKRLPAHGSLDASDLERNANVSSHRVIVENFFG
ncbi:hypothetical protein H257_17340 [Aphanomyces astaci]|uniref:DDE Tnp4 domain-containing protein n=1 Tax=Aphanomyces astaci TaxID=112090 RepID=W4FH72_APHAT|nr:hypothetical protein H257_17340 [Aphanomyces astaci]ETV66209.1 hypothetical protein H257_17340 [Aphanomyces astaci]|eukprot:XP_009844398.1 hypothetical protein H257_17340 [Aphanomyces astaci]